MRSCSWPHRTRIAARVSAAEHLVGVAGPDLGNARGGLVAALTSPTLALVSGGLLCVLGVAAVALRNPALRRYRPDRSAPLECSS